MAAHFLSKLFEPTSIAVIGASNRINSVPMKVFANLLGNGYKGKLYPVNPKHKSIQHQRCFPTVSDIEDIIDLAIITTPANTVPKIISECGNKGIRHVIIISSGFSEMGMEGKILEQHILHIAKGYHMHLLGPHCLGIMRPTLKMNATYNDTFANPGHLAFISQSGALAAGILDWAADKKLGFSAVVSLGNSTDIDFADILDFLTVDSHTESILLCIENIYHSRKFISALRAAARMKPVIIIKVGRHATNTSHLTPPTTTLIGDDAIFDAVLKRAGAVRVLTIEELFLAAEILSSRYRAQGNRLLIITNGGGAGKMAADYATDLNIQLPALSDDILNELNKILPKQWSHQNPIDMTGDADPECYQRVLNICSKAENIDGILTILVPVAMAEPLKVAQMIINNVNKIKKPILACWIGEKRVKTSWELFANHHIPYFDTPEKAVQAFSYLADYHLNQQLLLQVPEPLSPQPKPDVGFARYIVDKALSEKRYTLTAFEAKALLSAFFIPVSTTISDSTKIEVFQATQTFNYPIAISVIRDIIFGPVISFGAGGTLVEIMKDRALAIPPLNTFITKQLIEETRIAKLLKHFPNIPPVNLTLIINILLRISEMICEIPEIEEMDINPLIFNGQSAMVVDTRISISSLTKVKKRYEHMAIHPYPQHLIYSHLLEEGLGIVIRPIRPEDALLIQEFVRNLSSQSKYFRFMQHIRELTSEALIRLTQIDYDREMTFIATHVEKDIEKCIGVAHYITNPDRESCEFAIAVADRWQHRGIGSRLMKTLCGEAKNQNISKIIGAVLATNNAMLEMTQHLGFVATSSEDPTITLITKYI